MANERIPNNPYRANDPYRSTLSDDDFGRAARLDDELRAPPPAARSRCSRSP
jgi:hypothetical protein